MRLASLLLRERVLLVAGKVARGSPVASLLVPVAMREQGLAAGRSRGGSAGTGTAGCGVGAGRKLQAALGPRERDKSTGVGTALGGGCV